MRFDRKLLTSGRLAAFVEASDPRLWPHCRHNADTLREAGPEDLPGEPIPERENEKKVWSSKDREHAKQNKNLKTTIAKELETENPLGGPTTKGPAEASAENTFDATAGTPADEREQTQSQDPWRPPGGYRW